MVLQRNYDVNAVRHHGDGVFESPFTVYGDYPIWDDRHASPAKGSSTLLERFWFHSIGNLTDLKCLPIFPSGDGQYFGVSIETTYRPAPLLDQSEALRSHTPIWL